MSVPANNALQLLTRSTARVRSKVALRLGDRGVTYGELLKMTEEAAAGLRALGVQRGNRVLHFAQNSPEHVALYFACAWIGAVYVPIHASFRDGEMKHVAQLTQAAGAPVAITGDGMASTFLDFYLTVDGLPPLVVDLGSASAVGPGQDSAGPSIVPRDVLFAKCGDAGPVEDVKREDPFLMILTSGSSSRPKPVLVSHSAEIWNAETYPKAFDYRETDTYLLAVPMSWSAGLSSITVPMIGIGGTVVMMSRFNPVLALETITNGGVTLIKGPSTMYAMLVDAWRQVGGEPLSSVRRMYVGGEARNETAIQELERRLGQRIYEAYGATEARPVTTVNPDDEHAPYGSVGRLVEGAEMRLVDRDGLDVAPGEPGEAWVRCPGQMLSYDGDPELTAERVTADGWFRTGDLLTRDRAGYLHVVGRLGQMIIRGGSNIAPAEVERALMALPAVADATVVGLPDPLKGERVVATVVLERGTSASEEELIDEVAEHLAAYKVPQHVLIVEELAVGTAGKRDRSAIQRQAAALLAHRSTSVRAR